MKMGHFTVTIVIAIITTTLTLSQADNHGDQIEVSFLPEDGDPSFVLMEGNNETIETTVSGIKGNISVVVESENTDYFVIIPTDYHMDVVNGTATFDIMIRGVFIGVSPLIMHLEHVYTYVDDNGKEVTEIEHFEKHYSVRCGLKPNFWNTIFTWTLTVWLVISYVTMGAKIDLDVVWTKFRRPFGVTIGIICQFGIMPILAFALAKAFPISSESAIGLLIEGSCPGGWLSNVFALMMDVDFILSITMTFCSSFMALAMMPFNMFLYATPFVGERGALKTPYKDICTQLAIMMVPVLVGMYILRKHPNIAHKMTRGLKPVSMGLIIISMVFGIPAMSYIFVTPFITYVAASLLPLIGGILGFSIAKICCRSYPEAFTIAFETGVQNSLLASVVARFSYPFPENFLIARLPLLTAILTIIEGTIMICVYVTYGIVTGKRKKPSDKEEKGYEPRDEQKGDDKGAASSENNNPSSYTRLPSEDRGTADGDADAAGVDCEETTEYTALRNDEEKNETNV